MRFMSAALLCLPGCSNRPFDADEALALGLTIDARKGLGENEQAHQDCVYSRTKNIVDNMHSIAELEALVRKCEERLRRGYDERSALFQLKMCAVVRLAKIGGAPSAEALVRLFRQDLNWDGEAGFSIFEAIRACGPVALPALERWREADSDTTATELAKQIEGQSRRAE